MPQDHSVKVYDPSVSMTTPTQVIEGGNTAAGRFVSLADTTPGRRPEQRQPLRRRQHDAARRASQAAVYEFNADGVFRGQLEHSIIHGAPIGIAIDDSATPANGQVYVTSGNGSSVVIPPELGPPVTEYGALYAFGPAGPGQSINVTTSGAGTAASPATPSGSTVRAAAKRN